MGFPCIIPFHWLSWIIILNKHWMLPVSASVQRRRYLFWLSRHLPSESPLCRDWPSSPRCLQETSYYLRKLYHKWRVSIFSLYYTGGSPQFKLTILPDSNFLRIILNFILKSLNILNEFITYKSLKFKGKHSQFEVNFSYYNWKTAIYSRGDRG